MTCVIDVASWMLSDCLHQLNVAKNDVLWYSSPASDSNRTYYGWRDCPFTLFVISGLTLTDAITMRAHVVSNCFAVLRQISGIRRSVTKPVHQSLVVSMVLTRTDYESATVAGQTNTLLNRLQSVLHATNLPGSDIQSLNSFTP